MKEAGGIGKVWTFLSAGIFFATCGLLVYASWTGSNVFDKYKVDQLSDGVLYEQDWDDLMDDLNNNVVPDGAIVAFDKETEECPEGWTRYNLTEDYLYCIKGAANPCPAMGGCEAAEHGRECVTYENNAPVGSACVPTTSVCINGQWNQEPKEHSSCTARCAELGVCGETDSGGTCNSYTTNKSVGSACPKTVSTCQSNGQWDREPEQYGSCSVYCEQQRRYDSNYNHFELCPESPKGKTCVTYEVTEATDCNQRKVTSTCQSNGTWDKHPDYYTTCTTIPAYSSSSYYGAGSEVTCGYYSDGKGGYEWVPDASAINRHGDFSDGACMMFPQQAIMKCRANVYCNHYNVTCTKDGDRCRASNSSFSSYCCCTVGKDYNCIK